MRHLYARITTLGVVAVLATGITTGRAHAQLMPKFGIMAGGNIEALADLDGATTLNAVFGVSSGYHFGACCRYRNAHRRHSPSRYLPQCRIAVRRRHFPIGGQFQGQLPHLPDRREAQRHSPYCTSSRVQSFRSWCRAALRASSRVASSPSPPRVGSDWDSISGRSRALLEPDQAHRIDISDRGHHGNWRRSGEQCSSIQSRRLVLLEIRRARPQYFTVVSRVGYRRDGKGESLYNLGKQYAVCPICSHRNAIWGRPVTKQCSECAYEGEVGWWEE